MTRAAQIRDNLMPWMGLAGGGTTYALFHQIGSDGAFQNCALVSPWGVLIAGLLSIVAIAGSGWLSWRAARAAGEGGTRWFIGTISSMLTVLLLFATILPMIAALLIPRCFG